MTKPINLFSLFIIIKNMLIAYILSLLLLLFFESIIKILNIPTYKQFVCCMFRYSASFPPMKSIFLFGEEKNNILCFIPVRKFHSGFMATHIGCLFIRESVFVFYNLIIPYGDSLYMRTQHLAIQYQTNIDFSYSKYPYLIYFASICSLYL